MQTQLASERKRMNRMLGKNLYPHHARGRSNTLNTLNEQIELAAQSNTSVIITGEPGVETERVAAAIHAASPNSLNAMVSIHCSAHSEEELEQRLFSSTSSFTKAPGGVVFINEISALPPSLQIKLHKFLTEKRYDNTRIIAASTNDLEDAVKQGTFREDLYYQLNLFSIRIPPLRERREDVLTLAEIFAERSARQQGKTIERLGTGAVQALLNYYWPGNVTELEASIDYAVKRADSTVVHARHLPLAVRSPSENEASAGFEEQVNQLETDLLYDALKRTHGNISAAARDLGITARMVRYKVQKLNIPY
ncbi:sigma 54-interacting transcriptional regulator, partial [bacterium]|nr:sigma 54-interacting transcriptional regulator [bacterium]